jgi:hypothetical protein
MGFVVVVDRRVVVLVIVSDGHVLPSRSVTLIVDHMGVCVLVNQSVVVMHRQRPHLLSLGSVEILARPLWEGQGLTRPSSQLAPPGAGLARRAGRGAPTRKGSGR